LEARLHVALACEVGIARFSDHMRHNVLVDDPLHRSSAIARSDNIQGGTPVFAGTRVPVTILFDHLEDGESLESFLRQYPSVTREQALEVLEAAKARVTLGA